MDLIETTEGYVNSAHVARIDYAATGERLFLDSTGKIIGKQRGMGAMPEPSVPVIPAAPGSYCMILWNASEGDEGITLETVRTEFPLVVGWRVYAEGADPILIEGSPGRHALVYFQDHDGRWRLPDFGIYGDVAEAKAAALQIFRDRRL